MVYQNNVCVLIHDKPNKEKSFRLAENLGIQCVDTPDHAFLYQFVYTDNCLELQDNPAVFSRKRSPVSVNFSYKDRIDRRIASTTIKNPLPKAVGVKPGFRPTVIDTTAGLGFDGFSLAWIGCKTTLLERSSIIHALLLDGINRSQLHPKLSEIIKNNIALHNIDSRNFLKNMIEAPDTILMDPMYPQSKNRNVKSRKEMQILRDIVGDDPDTENLFRTAAEIRPGRIVVKRPKGGSLITDHPLPSFTIPMKSGRFDIYLKDHL